MRTQDILSMVENNIIITAAVAFIVFLFAVALTDTLGYRPDRDQQHSDVALPGAVVRVDEEAWAKTLEALERAYAEACNEAVASLYRGDRARGFQGYVCKPVRGTMFVEFEGRTIGWEPIRLPWKVER